MLVGGKSPLQKHLKMKHSRCEIPFFEAQEKSARNSCLPEGCAHEPPPGCRVPTFDTALNPEGSWLLASAFSPTLFRLALSSAPGPVPQPLLLQKWQARKA